MHHYVNCEISCRSVEPLLIYCHFAIYKMAAVRHLGCILRVFGLPTNRAAVTKYCDQHVCVCVSLSVCPRGYLRNNRRDLYQIFVRVAYGRDSVLLRSPCDSYLAYFRFLG